MTTEDLRGGGWAPGHYTITCIDCKDRDPHTPPLGAKRSFRCQQHAEVALERIRRMGCEEPPLVIDMDAAQKLLDRLRENAALTTPKPLHDPTPLSGCYSLDLYCDHFNPDHVWDEFPHQYTDERGSACRAEARRDGWRIRSTGMATCPKCVKALK